MPTTDTVIIGAGHAGLAMSHCLTERGISHVVLERGRVGQRWRTGRWDSFRLLTPNWLSRLPGWTYAGEDPDGFMTAADFVDHLVAYAQVSRAPVREHTTVIDVSLRDGGYLVATDAGTWRTRCVVIATGYHARSVVPELAASLAPSVSQLSAAAYRNPSQLPDGDVLVVGASATGMQLADELARAGRTVTIAVGQHTRVPRRYRGRDILWWLDRIGSLDRTLDELPDADRALREPSLQLAAERRLDLQVLRENGVRLAGRLVGLAGGRAEFADDLAASTALADARLRRVRRAIDRYAGSAGEDAPRSFVAGGGPRQATGLRAVVWATGFRPTYPWLRVPVLNATGRLRHRRGVTPAPGLYAIGLKFQHRRNATFIDGARHDAAHLTDLIADRLRSTVQTGRRTA